ncbi:hypothetical protein XAC3608_520054 [Xanthomonas citri pv. citri]|nr:hypothetical protein XAC3608_520054 [Xanthomonas citri pv. citri]CEI17627.1 hypothetical protein XACG115_850078 [Xanthomonas citri pv. citri]
MQTTLRDACRRGRPQPPQAVSPAAPPDLVRAIALRGALVEAAARHWRWFDVKPGGESDPHSLWNQDLSASTQPYLPMLQSNMIFQTIGDDPPVLRYEVRLLPSPHGFGLAGLSLSGSRLAISPRTIH